MANDEKKLIEVIDPSPLIDLDRMVDDAAATPEICLEPDTHDHLRSCVSAHGFIIQPGRHMAFDHDRGLWLDPATIVEQAKKVEGVRLTKQKVSRVRRLLQKLSPLAGTKAALGALFSVLIGLSTAYERGIDTYLERVSVGEQVVSDNPAVIHLTAPFVGAVEISKDAIQAVKEFTHRVEVKDDSLRNVMEMPMPIDSDTQLMPTDHTTIDSVRKEATTLRQRLPSILPMFEVPDMPPTQAPVPQASTRRGRTQ